MKKPLMIVAGATASGKSDAAVALAERLNGEIVSADSMQVYRYMDIGTAKPTAEEMCGIPHYLVDELLPDAEYSAAIFQQKAKVYIEDIAARGKTPIVCGGTGFYINALLYETDFTETISDAAFREQKLAVAASRGNDFLHKQLQVIDPDAAAAIHANNVRRVIRALEYHAQTGRRISEHNTEERQRESAYDAQMVVLVRERAALYERIERRVDKMLAEGLVAEVEAILARGYSEKLPSMQGLGYKEIVRYINGEYTLEEAVRVLKRDTRHFAKRQFTWFAHQTGSDVKTVQAGESAEKTAERIIAALAVHE